MQSEAQLNTAMNKKKFRFSGHQTFPFRYGWLEKGFRFASQSSKFTADNAIVALGVGKNMVESIKYWCELTGILCEGKVTAFARALLDEETGWDPFLEDDASLWLLHWKMITNPEFATAGTALFSLLHKPEFSKSELLEAISLLLERQGKNHLSDQVILRDVDCYLRSYVGARRAEKKKSGEESFDCPLQAIGLVHQMTDAEMYRFSIGPKLSLPPEIIGYAIWDYMHRNRERSSLRVQEALYHENSPGQVFMLDENSLIEAITELSMHPARAGRFNFTESAGIALIHCSISDGNELLNHYYFRGHA